MIELTTIEELEQVLKIEKAVSVYFSNDHCSICKVLKPKVSEMLSLRYPLIKQIYINTEKSLEIIGQYRVFTVPVIICFFEGKEIIRKIRNFGIDQLMHEINRPYQFLTGV